MQSLEFRKSIMNHFLHSCYEIVTSPFNIHNSCCFNAFFEGTRRVFTRVTVSGFGGHIGQYG